MRRRAFLAALGGVASLPLTARAQQAVPVIGFIRSTTAEASSPFVAAFRQGIKEAGFVEGTSVVIEYRHGDGDDDRLPALVTELLRRPVNVIAANVNAARAAKSLTTTVPIVFITGNDPVADGLVASHNRPGGNLTGVSFISGQLVSKRLQMLRAIVPKAEIMAMIAEVDTLEAAAERRDAEAAARALGQQLVVLNVAADHDIEAAFETIVQRKAGALVVGSGPFFTARRNRITALAAKHALPAFYTSREYAVAGGLMSYGGSITEAYRQGGLYTGRILKGEKPAELPVMQSSKFEFVINLKTAKTLGLEFHPQLLATADEVIE